MNKWRDLKKKKPEQGSGIWEFYIMGRLFHNLGERIGHGPIKS